MTSLAALNIKAGDDYSRTLTVTDDDDVAIDITDCTLTFHLRAPGATTDTITQALTLTTPASGIATLTLTDTQTATLSALVTYTFEVELVDGTGLISTPTEGLVYVARDLG